MGKALRIWLLLLLAFLTVVLRIVDLSEVVVRDVYHPMTLGFLWQPGETRMIVGQVAEENFDGNTNPFYAAGLRSGDHILEMRSVDGPGHRIRGLYDFGDALREIQRNEPATVIVERDFGGRMRQVLLDIPPGPGYGLRTWLVIVAWTLIFPLVAAGTGFFIGFMRPQDNNAFTASLMLICFSSYFTLAHFLFPPGFREVGSVYQAILALFLPYCILRFFLLFPSPSVIDRWMPALKQACLALTIAAAPLVLYYNYLFSQSFARLVELQRFGALVLLLMNALPVFMFLVGVVSLLLNTWQSESKDDKRRMRILLAGTGVGLGPLIIFMVWLRLFGTFAWGAFFLVFATLMVFPLSFAYAVVRHRVMGVQLIIRRGMQYALVSRGFLAVEFLLIFLFLSLAATPVLVRLFPNSWAFANALGAGILLMGVHALNKRIMPVIDRRFFREAYNAQRILSGLSRDVRKLATDPDRLLCTVIERISDSLYPDQVAIFLRGAELAPAPQVSAEGQERRIRFRPDGELDFECHWHRVRTAQQRAVAEGGADPQQLSDSPPVSRRPAQELRLEHDAFIPRYLKRYLDEEPEALDVYLDDPRSWASALVKADSTDKLAQEKELVEQLNMRLIIPLTGRSRVMGFICLGERLSEEPYSSQDKELLLTVAEQTSIALDYAYLIEQAAEQEKVRRDLEIAKEVQTHLFPQNLPASKTLQYMGVCHPARGVGGDYYDFLGLEDRRICLALGDISGKGISAALLMASLQGLLRSHATQQGAEVASILQRVNRLMCTSTEASKYATFFCAIYDDRSRRLTFVNAGHNPPFLFRPRLSGGNGESDSLIETLRLRTGGMVVGIFPESEYEQETVQMKPGDVLVVFSDGVSEARNESDEEYGEERLQRIVCENIELPASKMCDMVVKDIRRFTGQAPQHDDLTLMIAKSVG
ncbi:MAG TPA: SpoIIE family protein phosphatase [Acidobacteriota bacterium]|nr:SpoIIE family protein phosphatase [Acidobacteriota bacterium]